MEEKKSFKHYFHKSQLSLDHPEPVRFVRGTWHPGTGPPVRPLFMMFRILMTSLFVGAFVWSIVIHWRSGKWLIFATHWSFTMCTVQAIIGCYLVVSEFLRHRSNKKTNHDDNVTCSPRTMPRIYKIYWLTYNMALPVAFAVTALYWGIIFPSGEKVHDGPSNVPLNIVMHAGNSVLCLAEVFFGGLPSRPAHALHTFLFGLSYVGFNLIYWALGGLGPFDNSFIYKTMDWSGKPGLASALSVCGVFLLVILHWIICWLSVMRTKCVHLRYQNKDTFTNVQLPELNGGKFNTGYEP